MLTGTSVYHPVAAPSSELVHWCTTWHLRVNGTQNQLSLVNGMRIIKESLNFTLCNGNISNMCFDTESENSRINLSPFASIGRYLTSIGKVRDIMSKYLISDLIFPKKGDRSNTSNCRPIALTSAVAKVFETLLNSHFIKHLESNNLLSDHQYGFRKARSTGDLFSYLTHVWSLLGTSENHSSSLLISLRHLTESGIRLC